MKLSIIIPTFNNLDYLKFFLRSLKINSTFDHEIILHINDGSDGTLKYALDNNIKHTYSETNIGLCSSMNKAYSLTTTDHILYAHDDMYFCKNWDIFLIDEINKQNNNQYYLSGTNVSTRHGLINFNCGLTYLDFDEKKFHNFCSQDQTPDLQSSHWAPHLIHKELWDKIGGFSEEFNPGDGSDPDFCMKLWLNDVRIFKGVSKFKVYHFNSITTRNSKIVLNNGTKTFLSKYGFNPKFFRKHYLKGNNSVVPFKGRLNNPKKNFSMLLDLTINKIKYTINKFRA
ncbi:glycosyltransferase [Candidatus Pelagibacter sp.]|jgi:glycosyltransferase involved in cell wall biosynthesis|nr:glycosyltransferase [Candidatus Pelagibacter sp.]